VEKKDPLPPLLPLIVRLWFQIIALLYRVEY
jgi:hypothetical protein